MSLDELESRFPDLDLTKNKPTLYTLNSIGFGLYGRRLDDHETGTYVKTHCFCVLWIPVLPIASYRVADAASGWFILGRMPPSPIEQLVRGTVLAALVGVALAFAWGGYTGTDSYKDAKAWDEAEKALEDGDLERAAMRLRNLTRDNPRLRIDARAGLAQLVSMVGPETDADDARRVFEAAADPRDSQGPVVDDLWLQVVTFVNAQRRATTRSRVETLEAMSDLAPAAEDFHNARRRLVDAAVAENASDLWAVSALAAYLEQEGDLAACETLLAPHAAALGSQEGARILGQIHAASGRVEESFALLQPYVATRLQEFRTAFDEYDALYQRQSDEAVQQLENGYAPENWYAKYERSSEEQQFVMVQEWIGKRLEVDPRVVAARDRYLESVGVVPVAMDLGIVRLQRSRAMEDKIAAHRELMAVEEIFEAIHGVAQDDADYLLTAAQVAFWLGKPKDCEAHLLAVIKAGLGDFDSRMAVGGVWHSLGESQRACEHWKKAYDRAETDEQLGQAASAVGVVTERIDMREAVTWFERVPTPPLSVQASLASARAAVALEDGDRVTARTRFEESLAIYDRLPQDSTTLNNGALVAHQLAGLTGDLDTLADAAQRLRKAVAASPTSVILMQNTAASLFALAQARAISGPVDLQIGISTFRSLEYDSSEGRDAIVQRLADREETREAIALLDRCIALTERNADAVLARVGIASATRDAATLRRLLEHVQARPPDSEFLRQQYVASLLTPVQPAAIRAAVEQSSRRLRELPANTAQTLRAAAELNEIGAIVSAELVEVDVDADVEALARRAAAMHAAQPSSGTRWAVRTVALLRLHKRMRAMDDRYARETERLAQHIFPDSLIAEALHRDEALRTRVRATDELRDLLASIEESTRKFPDELGAIYWALLRHGTDEQARVAAESAFDEFDRLQNEIQTLCLPFASTPALHRAWELRRAGDDAGADAVLAACRKYGTLLPYQD